MKKRALSGLLKLDGPLLSILSLLIAIVISGVIDGGVRLQPHSRPFGAIPWPAPSAASAPLSQTLTPGHPV